ncbi:MAG: 50S ribosomal protein L21 [Lactobacillaceae bacterium]|jgi:large subunit ribosomal protein L21|nr:50S ribosomal protein L21 [Lactobacillaceae bacterium]
MYAVIKTGGKQYKVAGGDLIKIEKITGDEGSEVVFNEVLALGETIGSPLVSGASVKGQVVKQAKDKKVIIFKKKRRHNYRRKNGHRQEITLVKITDIVGKTASKPKVAKASASEAAGE